jgi:hypothetical protein
MTLAEAEQRLRQGFSPFLEGRGFRRIRGLVFVRNQEQCLQRIALSAFKDRLGGARFSLGVGVRFSAVEDCRREKLDAIAPTLGVPIHLLSEDRKYHDWTVSEDPKVWSDVLEDVKREIELRALPFLDDHCTMEAVKARLATGDPHAWFALDAISRFELLALIECAEGNVERAIGVLETALEQLAEEPPKRRVPLERLRQHIAER